MRALQARVVDLLAELERVRPSSGLGARMFSVTPSGDVFAGRLGERPGMRVAGPGHLAPPALTRRPGRPRAPAVLGALAAPGAPVQDAVSR